MSEPLARTEVPAASEAAEPPEDPPTASAGLWGVAGHSPQPAVREARTGELGRGRPRVDYRARGEMTPRELGGALGDPVAVDERTEGPALAGDRLLLLDRDRQPLQRPRSLAARSVPGLGVARGRERLIEERLCEGVDGSLDLTGAGNDRLHQLHRRQLPGTKAPERLGGGGVDEVVHGSRALPSLGHALAEEVDRDDDEHDAQAGRQRLERIPLEHAGLTGGDHDAPVGGRRLYAEAQERDRREVDHRPREHERRLGDHERSEVGDQVTRADRPRRHALDLGGGDIVTGALADRRGAQDPGDVGRVGDRKRDRRRDQPGSEHGRGEDREQDTREREQDVHHRAEHRVHPAAPPRRDDRDERPGAHRQERDEQRAEHRCARSHHQP